MTPIHGRDCLLSIDIDGEFLPALCATDFTLNVRQDIVLATAPGTGFWRQRRRKGISEWDVSLSGLTKVDNSDGQISWFYLVQESVRGSVLTIQLLYEDESGNTVVITGDALIPEMSLSAPVQGFTSGTIGFVGTGGFTQETNVPVAPSGVCAVQETIYTTLAEGETSVTDALLTTDNAEVLWVTRSGFGLSYTTGTPINDQYAVDYATGTISFAADNPGNGEPIGIGWHITQ